MADMRDRLIELVGECKWWGSLDEMADHLLANGVIVQEWISVKDRLPDEGGFYLICQKGKSWFDEVIQTSRWSETTQTFRGAQAGSTMEFVTHWMPLPQPPEEAEKALREKENG